MTGYLSNMTEEKERINIRDKDMYYKLEGKRLNLLEAKYKLETRESDMRKIWSNLDDAIMSLCIGRQEGR